MTKGTTVADEDLAPVAPDEQAQGPAPEVLPNNDTADAPATVDAPQALPANDTPAVTEAIDAKVSQSADIGPALGDVQQQVAANEGWTVQSQGVYFDPARRPGYVVTVDELPDLSALEAAGVSPEAFIAGLVVAENDAARDYIQGATEEAKAEAQAAVDAEAAAANAAHPDVESVAEEDQGKHVAPDSLNLSTPSADNPAPDVSPEQPTPVSPDANKDNSPAAGTNPAVDPTVASDAAPTVSDATVADAAPADAPSLEEAQAHADAQAGIPADAPKVEAEVVAPDAPADAAPVDSEPAASPTEAQSENA